MAVRIGFHGLGRIGRNVFRLLYQHPDFDVRCVADVAPPESLVYLLNFDSIHGRFPEEVKQAHGHMFVNGRSIPIVSGRQPGEVRWRDYDVDIVIEASGKYRSHEVLERHIEAGARRVLLTNPGDDLSATFCVGVNDHKIDRTHKVVSNASCTSNALSLVLKTLDEAFGVEHASMTTVHAYTNELRLSDVPHQQHLRRSRAAAENIIPSLRPNAVRIAEALLPQLKGRVSGMALNVPVPDGSMIDLVTQLRRRVSPGEVNGVMQSAARGKLKGILDYTEQPLVSSDVIGNSHTGVFDGMLTKVLGGTLVKSVTWYDNGWGFANRVVDLLGRLAKTL